MLLELKNVRKKYKLGKGNEFEALKGIDVSFNPGELVAITGESGSGKSTLMNLLGGLDLDYQGSIKYNGYNLNKLKEKEIDNYRKTNIGFIFQSFNLIARMNVLNNVTLGATLSGVSKSEKQKRAKELLIKVGIEDHMYKKPNQLSGGQMQRVAIARALMNDPDIILADEPTGSLDSETSKQIIELIQEISNEDKLVIMVTHSEKVAATCNRIIKMTDGKIIDDKLVNTEEPIKKADNNIIKKSSSISAFSSFALALRNMKEKIGRNILIAIGASIGIASIIVIMSLGQGIENYMTGTMEDLVNPRVVEVNKIAENDSEEAESMPPGPPFMTGEAEPFTEDELNELTKIDGVSTIEPGFTKMSMQGSSIKYGDEETNFMILGTTSSNMTKGNIEEGNMPSTNEVLIDSSASDKLGEDIVGSTVTITTTIDNTEITKDFKVSGIYASSGMGNMSSIYFTYDELNAFAKDNDIGIEPTVAFLLCDNEDATASVKEKIISMGYTGSMQEAMLKSIVSMIDVVSYLLAGIAAIALLVSAIMILVVMYISVVERTAEIGLMKALGARRKDIRRIFSSEALLIGFFGGILGVISSLIMGGIINSLTTNLFDIAIADVVPVYMLAGIILSVVVSLISGILPAMKAAKLDPVESLRHE